MWKSVSKWRRRPPLLIRWRHLNYPHISSLSLLSSSLSLTLFLSLLYLTTFFFIAYWKCNSTFFLSSRFSLLFFLFFEPAKVAAAAAAAVCFARSTSPLLDISFSLFRSHFLIFSFESHLSFNRFYKHNFCLAQLPSVFLSNASRFELSSDTLKNRFRCHLSHSFPLFPEIECIFSRQPSFLCRYGCKLKGAFKYWLHASFICCAAL